MGGILVVVINDLGVLGTLVVVLNDKCLAELLYEFPDVLLWHDHIQQDAAHANDHIVPIWHVHPPFLRIWVFARLQWSLPLKASGVNTMCWSMTYDTPMALKRDERKIQWEPYDNLRLSAPGSQLHRSQSMENRELNGASKAQGKGLRLVEGSRQECLLDCTTLWPGEDDSAPVAAKNPGKRNNRD